MNAFMKTFADEPEPPELQRYMARHTLGSAVARARQQYQINPVAPFQHPERIALGKAVRLCNGVNAVISGQSTCDCNSYRVSWFDRHFWQVRHKWVERGAFEVAELKSAPVFQSASQG